MLFFRRLRHHLASKKDNTDRFMSLKKIYFDKDLV